MFILDATTKTLEIKLSGAITTNQLSFTTGYADVNTSTQAVTPGAQDGVTNNTSAVTILAAPASGSERRLAALSVFNADTVPATVIIQLNDNSTIRTMQNITLSAGDNLVISQQKLTIYDSNGSIRTTASNNASSLIGTTLASNVVSSSITGVGTITGGIWSSSITGATIDRTTTSQAYRPTSAQTGNYTLTLSDGGKMVTLTSTSSVTLTIPANASVAFPAGTEIDVLQLGAGQVGVAITSDTLLSYTSLTKLAGQYAGATLKKTASTSWVLVGNLSA